MKLESEKIFIGIISSLSGIIIGVIVQNITKSDLLSIISIVIALFVIVGILVFLQSRKPKIEIISPKDRTRINQTTDFSGIFENLNGKNLYLIHHPKKKVGDPKDIDLHYYNNVLPYRIGDNKGCWTCTAHVGLEGECDNNREFEIFAVITGDSSPINNFLDVLPPRDVMHKIEVTRF